MERTHWEPGLVAENDVLRVEGVDLAVRWLWPAKPERGTPTLVLLHEGLGCIAMWRQFPARLAAATGRTVLLYDRRGYGRSAADPSRRGVDYLHRAAFDELPALLDAADVEEPLLVGHSDGGTIALLYASRHPVTAVVTEAAHVYVEQEALAGIRRAVQHFQNLDLAERLARYHGDKTNKVFSDWSDTWLADSFRNWNIEDCLGEVTCEVLLLQGEQDEYASKQHPQRILEQLAGVAEVVLLPDCGHSPHLQAAQATLQAMTAFITRQQRPADAVC